MAYESTDKKLGAAARQSFTAPTPPQTSVVVDYTTLLGLVFSFVLVIAAMFQGGQLKAFLDLNSFLIVIGGTAAVTMTSFSLTELGQSLKVIGNSVFHVSSDARSSAVFALKIAEINRKSGLLALETILPRLSKEHYLWQGLRLLIDGTPVTDVDKILMEELSGMVTRHNKTSTILRRAAEVAPAMGLIGTLIGLIQMLGASTNLSAVGPAMALALLATLYGAIMANIFLLPLASKLERHTDEELLVSKIYMIAVGSIGRRENPRKLESLVNAALPPTKRIRLFD